MSREYRIRDARIVTDRYQRRWWQWPDGHRIPYSTIQRPTPPPRRQIADGVDVGNNPFMRGLYDDSEF